MDAADDRVDRLYELPPGDFVAARDALAKELRAEGDREAAAEVRRLRRPTVAAWALNQLARRQPEDVAALVDVGRQLAAAQDEALSGGGGDLRALGRERMDRMRALARAAEGILASDGGGSHRDEIVATLTAASADPAAGAELLQARLGEALAAPTGFFGGVVPPPAPAPAPARRRAGRGTSAARTRAEEEEREERDKARAAAATEAAAAEAAAAREAADRAAVEAQAASEAAEAAARRVEQLEADLEAARVAAEQASEVAAAAHHRAADAARTADDRERAARP